MMLVCFFLEFWFNLFVCETLQIQCDDCGYVKSFIFQGAFVQSIISLTKSLMEDLLGLTVLKKSTAAIFFLKKYKDFLHCKNFGIKLIVICV